LKSMTVGYSRSNYHWMSDQFRWKEENEWKK
jgi:hypothetical protein